jgi:hypothetical protein
MSSRGDAIPTSRRSPRPAAGSPSEGIFLEFQAVNPHPDPRQNRITVRRKGEESSACPRGRS